MTANAITTGQSAGFIVACGDCQLAGGPYSAHVEATQLAGTHDRIHHGGRPTAEVTTGAVCESCRVQAATHAWSHPAAGAPFTLCRSCAAVVITGSGGGGA